MGSEDCTGGFLLLILNLQNNIEMNRILKSVIAAGLFISMAIGASAQRPVQVVSPIVHSDNTVTFNFLAPDAENVKISAQFAPKTDMVKGENGVCSASLYLGIIAQVAANVNRLFYYLHFVIIVNSIIGYPLSLYYFLKLLSIPIFLLS